MLRQLPIGILASLALALPATAEEVFVAIDITAPTPQMVSPDATETHVRSVSIVVMDSRDRAIRGDDDTYGLVDCDQRSWTRQTCSTTVNLPPGVYKILATHDGTVLLDSGGGGLLQRRNLSVHFEGSITFGGRRRESIISTSIPAWPYNETVDARSCVDEPDECSLVKAFSVQ